MLSWLFERFATARGQEAVISGDVAYTYGSLLDRIDDWRLELASQHIGLGHVVAIEADFSLHAIALLLTLIDVGAVVVPLSASVERQKPVFRRVAEIQFSFAIGPAGDSRVTSHGGTPQNALTAALIAKRHPGLVLFSSGSTGEPKAALHDFLPLLEKFKTERHSLRTITFLLFDHVGGINTLFYVLANRGTIVSVDDRSPDAVCATIARHRVELLPTSPTFLNMLLLSEAYTRHDLSSLQQVTYGTEPMTEFTIKRVAEVLPNVRLLQTYGLSELGILRSKSKSSDSLYVKVGGEGFETKVVDGTLRIRARSSMLGYLNAPTPFDADGWFNTNDEVIVEGEYLRILGRRSEIINVGGEKVYPAEVEGVLMMLPNVMDASVYGERNPITGMMVVASVVLRNPEDPLALRKRVRESCSKHLAPFKVPAKVLIESAPQHSPRFKKIRRARAAQ